MSELFSSLTPQDVIILGVAWLLREIFGFVYKLVHPAIMRANKEVNDSSIIAIKENVRQLKTIVHEHNQTVVSALDYIRGQIIEIRLRKQNSD